MKELNELSLPNAHVSDLIKQQASIQELQKLETTIRYGRGFDEKDYTVSVLVFTDVGGPSESSQLSTSFGLLI